MSVHFLNDIDENTGKVIRELGGAITELEISPAFGGNDEIEIKAVEFDELKNVSKEKLVCLTVSGRRVFLTQGEAIQLIDFLRIALQAGIQNLTKLD